MSDLVNETAELRPELIPVREPDDVPGASDHLKAGLGQETGHLFDRPAQANVLIVVDEERRRLQPGNIFQ